MTEDHVFALAAVSLQVGGEPEIRTIEVAAPKGHDILVDVEAVGICHADVAANNGEFPVAFPTILGHEGVGFVRSVGPEVATLVPGDRVVLSYDSCGECDRCRAGRRTQCASYLDHNFPFRDQPASGLSASGLGVHGGFFGQSSFATVARASDRNAVRVDTTLPAALLAPLGCGIQTGAGAVLNVARPAADDTVVVVGLGAVGFAAAITALNTGVRSVVAVDVRAERLELAEELGVPTLIDARQEDWPGMLRRDGRQGADVAIECSGNVRAFGSALACLRPGGTAVVIGVPSFGGSSPLDVSAVVNKSLIIRGTIEGDSDPTRMLPYLIGEIESGRLRLDRLVREFSFADVSGALQGIGGGSLIKPVLIMDPGPSTPPRLTPPTSRLREDE